uniref:Uncharacterized protein n=1 Tax=Meloidogyne enterolobii TaxID=390850 RepID=A0A6V7UWE7_MELEN|nr:unnamed protein product [Meloidogyne enterolobii]
MLINKLLLFINLIILFNLNATNDYSEDSDSSHMSEKVLSSEEYYEANNLNETSPDEDWMENESPSTSKPVNVINIYN